nr:hypothetical protein [Alcaligenes sp. HPC1271]
MAESPQTNSSTVAPSRSRGGATTIGLAVLLGVLLGGGGLWLYRSLTQPADQSEQIQLAMQNLARSQQSLQQIQSEFEGLRGQLVLEESTRKGLEKSLSSTQPNWRRRANSWPFTNSCSHPVPVVLLLSEPWTLQKGVICWSTRYCCNVTPQKERLFPVASSFS